MTHNGEHAETPRWLAEMFKTRWYVAAAAVAVIIANLSPIFDTISNLAAWFRKSDAFVLAEHSEKSEFSNNFAQQAWRRLFWADIFSDRVKNGASIKDIDDAWTAYMTANADWNANLMIWIVGLERYYDVKRSGQIEADIQPRFLALSEDLGKLRRSALVAKIRKADKEDLPTSDDKKEVAELAVQAGNMTTELRNTLYIMVTCFEKDNRKQNLCQ